MSSLPDIHYTKPWRSRLVFKRTRRPRLQPTAAGRRRLGTPVKARTSSSARRKHLYWCPRSFETPPSLFAETRISSRLGDPVCVGSRLPVRPLRRPVLSVGKYPRWSETQEVIRPCTRAWAEDVGRSVDCLPLEKAQERSHESDNPFLPEIIGSRRTRWG
jgi:hypothetical protein